MVHVIQSIEEFCKELKVGDIFWHMRSRHCVPHEIQGPCTILALFKDGRFKTFEVRYVWLQGDEQVIEENSILDLTNEWHGVFLNPADAYAYFEERKTVYAEDPIYIAEHRRARAISIARRRELRELRDLIDAL